MFKIWWTRCKDELLRVCRDLTQKKKDTNKTMVHKMNTKGTAKGGREHVDKIEAIREAILKFNNRQDTHDTLLMILQDISWRPEEEGGRNHSVQIRQS